MSYVIQTSKDFEKGIKHLAKRYRSIVSDYEQFLNSLEENPFIEF
jgi:mRNA-degrading endonuclease RelE of RelBE toxin-antitoxin system